MRPLFLWDPLVRPEPRARPRHCRPPSPSTSTPALRRPVLRFVIRGRAPPPAAVPALAPARRHLRLLRPVAVSASSSPAPSPTPTPEATSAASSSGQHLSLLLPAPQRRTRPPPASGHGHLQFVGQELKLIERKRTHGVYYLL